MRRLAFLITLGMAAAVPAWGQSPPISRLGTVTVPLNVTTSSANVALPSSLPVTTYPIVEICNTGSAAAYIATGVGSGTTATTSNLIIPPNSPRWLNVFSAGGNPTYLAAITASGTTTLNITQSTGGDTTSCGSSMVVSGVVTSGPANRTIVPLDISSVTTGGVAVTALSAGHATAGGWIMTANKAGICVDQTTTAGTVTGTPSTTGCVAGNAPFYLVPSSHAVSVNSSASSVSFGGEGLQ